ncbi:MAG TPA: HAMP domain-containing histidine kinase [Candidatus Bacteroides pullicola]|uniref:histidine kinase n=1 Tax=Candidatus Bacteroides pullicola TaxID=2838475 RepID=A0A9D1ZIC5_9BACE|nr:HAMP domain-containing histidine kinase [Candidatus Bacteroides pullicola]
MKDLAALSQEIEKLRAQLERQEKLSSLGMLSAGIAHEIRNPLNFVINFSNLSGNLLEEYRAMAEKATDGDNDMREDMEDILASLEENQRKIAEHGRHALDIINGILLYSRGKDDACQPTDTALLTREYVRLSYHAMRANCKDFNASIREDYETGLPPVNLNPQDYIRVVLNVMNNAWYAVWKKSQEHPRDYRPAVEVRLHRADGWLVLAVEDNGTGMDRETQEKVYDVFYTTKPAGHGTGLGMAIVKDIVENKHHGRIAFTSVPGERTCFTLSFPLSL